MKIYLISTIILTLITQISAIDPNIFSRTSSFDEKSIQSLCHNLQNITSSKQDSHDILIAKIDDNIRDSIVGDLSTCLGSDSPIVVTDLKEPIVIHGLNKAKLMIIEGSRINLDILSDLFKRNFNTQVWNYMANLLLISHTTIPEKQAAKLLFYSSRLGFLNVALMHKVKGIFKVKYTNAIPIELANTDVISTNDLKTPIFPDKLKNSVGFPIHIPVYNQPPFLLASSENVLCKMTKFVEILEEKMRAAVKYHLIKNPYEIQSYIKRRELHLVLNKINTPLNAPKLMTYEENGFCALVPKPPRTTVTDLIFIKPFDRQVWMFFGLTVVASLVIWRLFLNLGTSDSFWLLLFGIFAMFVGQSVQFLRTHRVVLVILLQLIVSMIFVLSNGYQGIITSFMIQPDHEHRIKTVKELIESDMRISASDVFVEIVKDSEEFQAIKSRVDVINSDLFIENELIDILNTSIYQKSVIILQCEWIRGFLKKYSAAKTSYYLLPQKIITIYGNLPVGNQNPFLQKFQNLMDLSFEAGLPQAWILFLERNFYMDKQLSQEMRNLGLKDLSQIYYFLIFGHTFAVFVYLVEKFFGDFINKLDLSFYTSKLRNYINELAKLKRKKQFGTKNRTNVLSKARKCCKKPKRPKVDKPKVRRIKVQPVASVA